jgi:hypothetical protein
LTNRSLRLRMFEILNQENSGDRPKMHTEAQQSTEYG